MASSLLLTVTLSNAANVNVTMVGITNAPEAKGAIQSLEKVGGFWDDAGAWHPTGAIISVIYTFV